MINRDGSNIDLPQVNIFTWMIMQIKNQLFLKDLEKHEEETVANV